MIYSPAFSGGFALGAYWAGIRFDKHYFSEVEPYAIELYRKRFPDAIPLGDIKEVDWNDLYLDAWCQDEYIKRNTHAEDKMAGKFKKLNEEKVQQAIQMYHRGLSLQNIGEFYGVTRQAMWDLLRRRIALRSHLKFGEDNHFYRGGIQSDDKVHNIVEKALKKGLLVPRDCETCGETYRFKDGRTAVQAHHDDYNKPLDVTWLCQKCHHVWHRDNKPVKREETKREPAEFIITGGFP